MSVKEELHRLVDQLPDEEATRLLELMERRRRNPLLQLDGIIASGRQDGAERHDTYLAGLSQ